MEIGIGYSSKESSTLAAREAAEQAFRSSAKPGFAIFFCTDEHDPSTVFREITSCIGDSKLVGASVPGFIVGREVFRKGIGVLIIYNEHLKAVTCLQNNLHQNPLEQGKKAGKKLSKEGLEGGKVIIFPDGFNANVTDFLKGLYEELGSSYSFMGGGAGDNLRFYRTYQFTEQGFDSSAAAVALLKGLDFNIAYGHGWETAGEPMIVTRAEGKVIYELDGIPAFTRYSEVLGGIEKENFAYYGMKYPLGIPSRKGEFLIRDPLLAKNDGSIELVTEVPENTLTVVMKGEPEKLIETSREVTALTLSNEKPKVALLFDCISRYLLLKEDFQQELDTICETLGDGVSLFGMLSFGEVEGTTGSPLFHNKSLLVAVG